MGGEQNRKKSILVKRSMWKKIQVVTSYQIKKKKISHTSENSFLVTAEKIPNPDSSVITAGRQFMIRRAETTRPKNKLHLNIALSYIVREKYVHLLFAPVYP